MKLSDIRNELKFIAKSFFYYGRGIQFLYMRYVVAPRILTHAQALERPKTRDDFSMHMFVGKRDFLMGVWSLASWYRYAREIGELVLHSDGSLRPFEISVLKRLFPSVRIEDSRTFLAQHASKLDEYPELKRFRETYKKFQIRIVDQHFLSGKTFRLFMDSDLLWFQEPSEITALLRDGVPVPHMMSNSDFIRLEFRDGSVTDDETSRPNGGLVLYREDQFNMGRCIEFLNKCDYIHKRFGDQAWVAWTLRPQLFPESTYIIKGTLTDAIVMRHYTAPQRAKFFFYGLNRVWKDILHRV